MRDINLRKKTKKRRRRRHGAKMKYSSRYTCPDERDSLNQKVYKEDKKESHFAPVLLKETDFVRGIHTP